MNKTIIYLLLLLCIGTLSSCNDESFYISTIDMKRNFWHRGDTATFDVQIEDTTSRYDITLLLRSNESYSWTNIYVISSICDSVTVLDKDTTQCHLFDISGRPTGNGLSNVKENIISLWEDYSFHSIGKHTINISHGMRNIELPGISSVTLRIVENDTIR